MPCTVPLKLPVARKESSRGILIENFSSEPSREPMVRI